MATILELAGLPQPKLVKLDPPLEAREQEFRQIYLSQRVAGKLQTEVPLWVSQWKRDGLPLEQVAALTAHFVAGGELIFDYDFNVLSKTKNGIRSYEDGIWELKTADVRLFGWFYQLDWFVGAAVDQAWKVKDHNLYTGYMSEVIRFRDNLDLNEPKFVPGGEPVNVVSNFYPA